MLLTNRCTAAHNRRGGRNNEGKHEGGRWVEKRAVERGEQAKPMKLSMTRQSVATAGETSKKERGRSGWREIHRE